MPLDRYQAHRLCLGNPKLVQGGCRPACVATDTLDQSGRPGRTDATMLLGWWEREVRTEADGGVGRFDLDVRVL